MTDQPSLGPALSPVMEAYHGLLGIARRGFPMPGSNTDTAVQHATPIIVQDRDGLPVEGRAELSFANATPADPTLTIMTTLLWETAQGKHEVRACNILVEEDAQDMAVSYSRAVPDSPLYIKPDRPAGALIRLFPPQITHTMPTDGQPADSDEAAVTALYHHTVVKAAASYEEPVKLCLLLGQTPRFVCADELIRIYKWFCSQAGAERFLADAPA